MFSSSEIGLMAAAARRRGLGALVTAIIVLCLGFTPGARADAPADEDDNEPPEVVEPIENQVIPEDEPFTLDISGNFEDPDGDPLIFVAEGLPGSLSMTEAGVISGTPTQDEIGRHPIRVVAIDPFAEFAVDRFRIRVVAVNDPPVIIRQREDPLRSDEDEDLRIRVADLEIVDPDTSLNGISILVQPGANYTVIDDDELRPDQDYNGPLTVPVVASDGVDQSDPFSMNVLIRSVNDPPRPVGEIADQVIDEDEFFQLDVAGAFEDVDGDTLQFSAEGLPNALSISSSGRISGTPRQADVGEYDVSVVARDPGGREGGQEFELTVRNVNDPPVITGQRPLETNEDTNLTIRLSDLIIEDPDDSLSGMTLRLADGPNYSVSGTTVRPATNYFGTLTVPATVNDGDADSNTFNLSVTVRSVNDRPVVTGQDNLRIDEDNSLRFRLSMVTVSDPDNDYPDDFTFELAPGANYSVNGDRIVPRADYFGTLTVPLTVNDGRLDSEPFPLSIRVAPVNDPPQITGQREIRLDEDTERTITTADLVIEDPDNAESDFVLTLSPGPNYRLQGTRIVPDPNYNGPLSVPARVSDGEADSNVFTLSVDVRSVNDVPVIQSQRPLATEEDTPLEVTLADLTVSDPDHDYPEDFTLRVLPGENYDVAGTTVTPAEDFSGDLAAPVVVNDGVDDSSPFTLAISVGAVNDPPTIVGQQPIEVDEDGTVTITLDDLIVEDPDDPQSALVLRLREGENYTLEGTTVTPAADYFGALSVPATVSDPTSTSEPFELLVEVRPINDPPVITGQLPLTTPEDTPLVVAFGDLLVEDPDDSYPTDFTLTLLPGENYVATGSRIRPAQDFAGDLLVPAIVNDGDADSEPFSLMVAVSPVNDAPVISGQRDLVTEEDTPITITPADLLITDPDNVFPGDFTLTLEPGANYVLAGNTVRPDPNFNGRLDVPATVSDGSADSPPAILRIEVRSVNDLPRVVEPIADQQAVENEFFSLNVSANFDDADGEALTFAMTGLPPDGPFTLDPETGVLSGTPSFEDTRDVPFEVTIEARDESGGSGSDTFLLTVAALDRANVALDIAATPAPAMVEDQTRWTLTATNSGPSGADEVMISGNFAGSGLTITPAAGSDCSIASPSATRTRFECTIGGVPADGSAAVVFNMSSSDDGDVVVAGRAGVIGNLPIDPNDSDNEEQTSLSVAERLSNGAVQDLGQADVRAVAAADVDGDGDLDVVLGTDDDEPIEIYLGSGFRTLEQTPLLVPETAATEGIAVADLDGDGAPDLVFANADGRADSVYMNDGSGSFEQAASIGERDSRAVAVADFNGDGRADLAFAAVGANPVYVDNGTGAYVLVEDLGNATSLGVASLDFDGDGWTDLVFANSGSDSRLYRNDGAGGFAAAGRLKLGNATAVIAVDLDGDDRPDLAFARSPQAVGDIPSNPVLRNEGDGRFTEIATLGASPSTDVGAGDFDEDGRTDLFFVNATGTHQVWLGGADSFDLADEQIVETGAVVAVTGDLGNDGGPDILLGAIPDRGGALYLNDGFGRLGRGDAVPPVLTLVGEPVIQVPAGEPFADPGASAMDNIDGDISTSVVATSTVDNRIVGTYKVVYNVSDSAGNAADPLSRTVQVTPAEGGGGGGGGAVGPLGLLLGLSALFRYCGRGRRRTA